MTTPSLKPGSASSTQQHIDVLSRLVLGAFAADFLARKENLQIIQPDLEYVVALTEEERAEFLRLADMHHVTVRALQVLEKAAIRDQQKQMYEWCQAILERERSRIARAIESLAPVCEALEKSGSSVVVIKSLDHWPDLGSDLDLYTIGDPATVIRIMLESFHAQQEPRSWGDRLANKWNFSIPGLPEFIEIHIRYLGQTGEHRNMARRVIERRLRRTIGGRDFYVPAPEERVIISTLQRMYRHFYFRLCDMADFAALLQNNSIDFKELKSAAAAGGIWPGVATFLLLVSEYASSFGGIAPIPAEIRRASYSHFIRVYLGGNFLRVPKRPAAALYGFQLVNAARRFDLRAMFRLPLLPPLAISALLAYKFTGSDKGVW